MKVRVRRRGEVVAVCFTCKEVIYATRETRRYAYFEHEHPLHFMFFRERGLKRWVEQDPTIARVVSTAGAQLEWIVDGSVTKAVEELRRQLKGLPPAPEPCEVEEEPEEEEEPPEPEPSDEDLMRWAEWEAEQRDAATYTPYD